MAANMYGNWPAAQFSSVIIRTVGRLSHLSHFIPFQGNDLFKEGKYEAAISRYTTAIQLDPSNAVFPANRAMALLKVQR